MFGTAKFFHSFRLALILSIAVSGRETCAQNQSTEALAGTAFLNRSGDLASEMIDGIDRFLLRQIEHSPQSRLKEWKAAFAKNDYSGFVSEKRKLLRNQIGLVDQRVKFPKFRVQNTLTAETLNSDEIASTSMSVAFQVQWPVFPGVDAVGILVCPKDSSKLRFGAVLLPDASQIPEDLCGISANSRKVGFELADRGGLVVIPEVLSRTREPRNGRAVLSDQEFIYRSAFVLGRHVLGYQCHEVLAAVEAMKTRDAKLPILVSGWGEGGWIAMHAAAVDERIDVACISGHFGQREQLWKEPIHRNVQSSLLHFGDAQLASMIAPRPVVVDALPGPTVEIGGDGGAPGALAGPSLESIEKEAALAKEILQVQNLQGSLHLNIPKTTEANAQSSESLKLCLQLLGIESPESISTTEVQLIDRSRMLEQNFQSRRMDQVQKWDRFQQRILESVATERQWFWDLSKNATIENYHQLIQPARERFRTEVIGDWNQTLVHPNVRTRRIYDEAKWTGYEVVLDVFDEVFAFGVLLLPKDARPLSNRPCVVFQHGLEGRPKDTIEGDHQAYHNVSVQLVEQGYVVFAPQNLYLFKDRFRTLQRKSNPMGRTLFSIMVPQHEQIVRWLGSRPEVDRTRIAFYGLSYGGKSAMRIPALVPGYCLSICSADFNEWVWKNASTTSNYSYVWTGEYEIFEFGLGKTFNYAEMAALIAPRPFMVERGHFDGVAPDERVAFEFAKVNRLYTTILKDSGSCEIEWFNGPHTIHGKGTFRFLAKHLKL